MKKVKPLSRTPVKKGLIYCAPACGFDCTTAMHDKALAQAKHALSLLKNKKGWKIRMNHNCGWHSSLQKGGINLYISTYGGSDKVSYSTLMSREVGGIGGNPDWSVNKHFDDPNKAVEAQLRVAAKNLLSLQRTYNFSVAR